MKAKLEETSKLALKFSLVLKSKLWGSRTPKTSSAGACTHSSSQAKIEFFMDLVLIETANLVMVQSKIDIHPLAQSVS